MLAINAAKHNHFKFIILNGIFSIGILIRLGLVFRADFPLNDGGFFYSAINDLITNQFKLPIFVSYNISKIPYAYPPLSFYISGLLNLIGVDTLTSIRFLPVIFNILSIPAFYFLCKNIFYKDTQKYFATLAFAVLPPAYEWLIMGGGLTRSPAFLFMILAWAQSFQFIKTKSYKDLTLTIFILSLSGYFHIEIFMVAIILVVVTLLYHSGVKGSIKFVGFIIAGVMLLTSPYWLTVVRIHGISPFLSAFSSGDFDQIHSLTRLIVGNLTLELLFTPFLFLSFWGIVNSLLNKQYFLPLIVLLIAIINPRSLERSLILPLSLMAGIGFELFIISFININIPAGQLNANHKDFGKQFTISWLVIGFVVFFVLRTAITGAVFISIPNSGLNYLTLEDRTAMNWVKSYTDPAEKFLVLSEQDDWSMDYRSEWFPALAERQCVDTVQGSEWLTGKKFYTLQQIHENYNKCMRQNLFCIEQNNSNYNLDYSMIYISGKLSSDNGNITPFPIEIELRSSTKYQLIYENDLVSIFSFIKQ